MELAEPTWKEQRRAWPTGALGRRLWPVDAKRLNDN